MVVEVVVRRRVTDEAVETRFEALPPVDEDQQVYVRSPRERSGQGLDGGLQVDPGAAVHVNSTSTLVDEAARPLGLWP